MPEGRPFPNKHIPRLGVNLSVTFGEPLPAESIKASLVVLSSGSSGERSSSSGAVARCKGGFAQTNGTATGEMEGADCKMGQVRSEITAIIQHAVEEVGRNVSGSELGQS
jgi:monolysocardiolipin acyltransferase